MKYQILYYESRTYIYNVPDGIDPKAYFKKVDSGEIAPDEVNSKSQDCEIAEVDEKGNFLRFIRIE